MTTLTLNSRRINADMIPAEATHYTFKVAINAVGQEVTVVEFKTSERSAKVGFGKIKRSPIDYKKFGWAAIQKSDRQYGTFAW